MAEPYSDEPCGMICVEFSDQAEREQWTKKTDNSPENEDDVKSHKDRLERFLADCAVGRRHGIARLDAALREMASTTEPQPSDGADREPELETPE